jgi:hypothetical protein
MAFFHSIRIVLYIFLVGLVVSSLLHGCSLDLPLQWLLSVVLLGITAERIYYTEHLPAGDPLNGGRNFYGAIHSSLPFLPVLNRVALDRTAAELLATSAIAVLWIPFMYASIISYHDRTSI